MKVVVNPNTYYRETLDKSLDHEVSNHGIYILFTKYEKAQCIPDDLPLDKSLDHKVSNHRIYIFFTKYEKAQCIPDGLPLYKSLDHENKRKAMKSATMEYSYFLQNMKKHNAYQMTYH